MAKQREKMEKSESIINLVTATIKVMEAVKGIDKTMVIGTGQNTYKGVPDQEVKKVIGEEMTKNGLAIFPIDIQESTQLSEWDEPYNGQPKRKQSIFTKVTTTYLLTHVSGEFMEVVGYGHGVDSQDKGAGKSTTYALKYLLLYLFLVPTGKIDDADITHNYDIATPAKKEETKPLPADLDAKLVECIALIENSNTVEEYTKVFNDNPLLQSNELLITAIKKQRRKFQKTNLTPEKS